MSDQILISPSGTGAAQNGEPDVTDPPAAGSRSMTALDVVRLVARREVRERLRSKFLIGSMVVLLIAVLAVAILPAVFDDEDVFRIGVAGRSADTVAAQLRGPAGEDATRTDVRVLPDAVTGEQLVRADELDAVVVDDREVIVNEDMDSELGEVLNAAHRQAVLADTLAAAGFPPDRAAAVLAPAPLAVRALEPVDDATRVRAFLAFIGTVLLYMHIVFSGSMIASGVVEEKTSRVIELLLAKAPSSHVLSGKLVGMGLLSFAQLAILVATGLTAGSLAGTVELPAAAFRVGIEVLGWYVLGYAIYASLFAMAGALAGRLEDLQNTSQIVSLIVMLGYGASIVTLASPDGIVARVSAIVPITAPMVLPGRSAAGVMAWWEPAVALVLVLATIVLVIRLAARVYAGGALHFTGSLKLREALRRADQ